MTEMDVKWQGLERNVVDCLLKCGNIINRSQPIMAKLASTGKLRREIEEFQSKSINERISNILSSNKEIVEKVNSIVQGNVTHQNTELATPIKDTSMPSPPEINTPPYSPKFHQENLPQYDNILIESSDNPEKLQSQLDHTYFLVYEGQSEDGLKCGIGILKTKEGDIVYEGEWKNDKYEGKGILNNLFQTNPQNPGSFENLNEMGDAWLNYEGEFSDGLFNGYGSLQFCDHELFEGIFHHGKANGEGIYTFTSGEKLKGFWKENVLIEIIEE